MTDVERLIEENKNLIYYMIVKMNLPMRDEDYEEAGLIGLWKAINTYDDSKGTPFSTYACIVIHNELLQELRFRTNKDKLQLVSLDDKVGISDGKDLTYIDIIPSSSDDIEYVNYYQDAIENAKKLSPRDREVLRLYLHGYTPKEIADKLHISKQYVSIRYKKIRELLMK